MDTRLGNLKTDFNAIIDLIGNNISILQTLKSRIVKIKEIYMDFINTNRDNIFVFTLDSFHFQGKLIDIEYQDVLRLFHAITNRMYCDYYKLFKIIIEYVVQNIPDKKLMELIKMHDNFPVYKDLEPFKQYDFNYIQTLHETIIMILTYLNTYIINKNHDLQIYETKNKIGLNIDSFVNTFNFNNTVMKEKTELFITYIEFFHKLHTKYLKRFTTKMQLMLSQINNDIKFDTMNDVKTANKDILNEFKEGNIDKNLLRELRVSISDEVSTGEQSTTPESSRKSSGSLGSKYDVGSESSYDLQVPMNTPENSVSISGHYDENIYGDHLSQLTDDCLTENNNNDKAKYYIRNLELIEPPEDLVLAPFTEDLVLAPFTEDLVLAPFTEDMTQGLLI